MSQNPISYGDPLLMVYMQPALLDQFPAWTTLVVPELLGIKSERWKIKSGSNILFWHHNWDGGIAKRITCPRFYNISENKVITVKDAWNSNQSSWNPSFRRPLLDREMQVWKSLSSGWQTPIQTEEPDIILWNLGDKGLFTIKSLKQYLSASRNLPNHPDLTQVWASYIPKKCKFFPWSLYHRSINTIDKC